MEILAFYAAGNHAVYEMSRLPISMSKQILQYVGRNGIGYLAWVCLWVISISPCQAGHKSFDEATIETHPRKQWEVLVETAQMINADGNPNRYYFSTQMISLAYEPFRPLEIGPVRVRTQFLSTFFVAAILRGPESYYLGWGPQVRFIFPLGDSRWSFFGGGGGGFGFADANEDAKNDHGLGQDFTFILLGNAGFRYAVTESWSVWVGGMWHHLSNANLSEPNKQNTGPDEYGVLIGTGYAF